MSLEGIFVSPIAQDKLPTGHTKIQGQGPKNANLNDQMGIKKFLIEALIPIIGKIDT
jgi:hypothetical protein